LYSQQHLKLLIRLENKELSIGEYAVQHQEILHKAKELEKKQIVDAYENGQLKEAKKEFWTLGSLYYNETFNK
jgi:hypothetical protein